MAEVGDDREAGQLREEPPAMMAHFTRLRARQSGFRLGAGSAGRERRTRDVDAGSVAPACLRYHPLS
jgi:hypothetical protein